MLEKVKKSWSLITVKIAICAVLVTFISLFLHWFTLGNEGQSLMQAIQADPNFFAGAVPLILLGLLWVIAFFLIDHPKLTLVGDALLLFLYAAFTLAGLDHNLNIGIGSYLYLIAVLGCVVCAFATKKQGKRQPVK